MANEIYEKTWKFMKENKFQLINEINSDLICNICNKLMVKSCNAPCSCKYCYDCIEKYLDGKDKLCPGQDEYCQMINFEKDIVINYPTNRKIAEIFVKCANKYCDFTDRLSSIENHIKTCDKNPTSCPYVEMGCKDDEVMNDEMKNHLCTEIYCHTKLLLNSINNLRNEMESMKNDIVQLKLENKDLKEKINIIEIESKSYKMKNKELNKEIFLIKRENESLVNKLENIEKSRINEVIERIQRKLEQQTLEIDEIKEKFEQTNNKEIEMRRIFDETFDKNADLVKKSNIDYDEKINNLQIKIIEMQANIEILNFGKFRWTIENFSQQKRCKDIYSDSFYSHKNGYKMCLSVRIGHDYVFVYFHLMRGNFDEVLFWPFKHSITIDVINQMNGEAYTSETINYENKPKDKGWDKPTNERNDSIYIHEINDLKQIIHNDQMLINCKIKI